ncbi:MAG: AmmeMemoRadiSam system radical SAM enzyme [Candidatus Heimdallarchaeota archaeon]
MTEVLVDLLNSKTTTGELYRSLPTQPEFIQCYACAHYCKIKNGRSGICKIRFNEEGSLKVPYGYVGAWQCDPIEKKPFYHAFPSSNAMSFGMLGCDYHCGYCQNWLTSQALKDPRARAGSYVKDVTPEEFVDRAIELEARVITSTYNEPLITSEWAVAIFKVARQQGLATSYVSNGNATPEVLDYLRPYLDLYKIDLKTFDDKNYRRLGGTLEAVLKGIKGVFERGMWLEIVTLVVPTFNDSEEELTQIAEFIADVSTDIPWHVTAFHKDYKMTDPSNTSAETLIRAAEIGEKAGLNYVYAGNLPGRVGKFSNTRCSCGHTLVKRLGFEVIEFSMEVENDAKKGFCPKCGEHIPGRWEEPQERNSLFRFMKFIQR